MKINAQLKGRMTHTDKGCQSQQKMWVSNKTGNATVFLPQHTLEIDNHKGKKTVNCVDMQEGHGRKYK